MAERSIEQKERLLDFFLTSGSLGFDKEFKKLGLGDLKKKIAKLNEGLPKVSRPPTLTTAILKRETFVQIRGDFRMPGKLVSANAPELLHDLVI